LSSLREQARNIICRYPKRTCSWPTSVCTKTLAPQPSHETQNTAFQINLSSLYTATYVSTVTNKPNEQHWQTQNITFHTGMHNNVWTEITDLWAGSTNSGLATAVKLTAAMSQDAAIFSINEHVYVLRHTRVPPKLYKSDSTRLQNLTQDTGSQIWL